MSWPRRRTLGPVVFMRRHLTVFSAQDRWQEMKLVPGQLLDGKALRTAEKNLAAFDATIEVIATNDSGFKDILVQVKKK